MLSKKVTFISAQPDSQYFHWQVEVMIHNFIKVGINPNWIEVIWAITDNPSQELVNLARKYPYIRFFWYQRTVNENYGYIPVVRPDILEQHFTAYPNLRGEVIFYHDSDIIFRKLPDFDSMHDDFYWYLSNTVSYIGAEYIKSKSPQLLIDLCSSIGVSPKLVEENEMNSGGAQYLMKGINATFWRKVKHDSLTIYKLMSDRENRERSILSPEQLKTYNPIQKWCADMWAVLWNCLKMGAQPRISKELDFSWGTSHISEYERCNIMHNAGVNPENKSTVFYKGDFIDKSPFDSDFSYVDPNLASSKYVEAIMYARDNRK